MVRGHGPTPAERPLVEYVEPAPLPQTRREALALLGAAAVVLGAAVKAGLEVADNVATRELWDNNETQFVTIEGTGVLERPEGAPPVNPFLVFDGLGREESIASGDECARYMLGEDASWIPVHAIRYSDDGVDLPKIREWIEASAKGKTGLNIVGVSKGTNEAILALAGMENPPHIDNLIIVASPFDLEDVPMKDVVKAIVDGNFEGTAWEKLLYQLAISMNIELRGSEQGGQSRRVFLSGLWRAARRAMSETVHGVSPKLFLSGLAIVRHVQTALLMEVLRDKGAITGDTTIYYAKSPAEKDPVVLVDRADARYGEKAKEVHAKYRSITYYDGGHAQAGFAFGAVREWFWKDQHARISQKKTSGRPPTFR